MASKKLINHRCCTNRPAEEDACGEALPDDRGLLVALLVGVPEAGLARVARLHLRLVVDVEGEAVGRVSVEEAAAREALHAPAAVLPRPEIGTQTEFGFKGSLIGELMPTTCMNLAGRRAPKIIEAPKGIQRVLLSFQDISFLQRLSGCPGAASIG